jgi:hypothetical protein
LFGSGWFDTGQPYKLSVPDWAWYQHHLGLAPICATCGIRKTPADRDKAVRAGKNYQGEWVCLDCDELDPGDVTTDTLDAANQRSQASPVVKELLTRDDFDAAIKGGEGVIVIEDYPNRTCTAHPVSCRHLQARHFVQKVIVNKRENGRYYLAGSFPEARRELDAEPCQGT